MIITRVLIIHSKKKLQNIPTEKGKKQKERSKGILKALISIMSVMIMFGLSWVFGAFSIGEGAIVFQWLFVIFNTSQGFMLFLFFCVIGADAREEWKNLLTCNKYKKKLSLNTSTSNSQSKSGFNHRRRHKGTLNSNSGVETMLTSDGRTSNTIRRSVGLPPLDESVDSVELPSRFSSEIVHSPLLSIHEEDTFVGTGQDKVKKSKQLPPHVYIKLKRPIYTVETITYDDDKKVDLSSGGYESTEVLNCNGATNEDNHGLMFSNSFQDSGDPPPHSQQVEKVDLSSDTHKDSAEMLDGSTAQNEDNRDQTFTNNFNEESLMESMGLDTTEPATQISTLSDESAGDSCLPLDIGTEEEKVEKTDTLTNLDDSNPDIESSQTALLNRDLEEETTRL